MVANCRSRALDSGARSPAGGRRVSGQSAAGLVGGVISGWGPRAKRRQSLIRTSLTLAGFLISPHFRFRIELTIESHRVLSVLVPPVTHTARMKERIDTPAGRARYGDVLTIIASGASLRRPPVSLGGTG